MKPYNVERRELMGKPMKKKGQRDAVDSHQRWWAYLRNQVVSRCLDVVMGIYGQMVKSSACG